MVQLSQSELIAAAIAGQVISFPTDTVPALAVKAEQAELIYQLKQRATHKPLILMGTDWLQLKPYVSLDSVLEQACLDLIAEHWPGALTLVLPASPLVPEVIHRGTNTVGIRAPNLAIAQTILDGTGVLATTSVNRSGEPPCETIALIAAEFPDLPVLAAIDPNEKLGHGLPSTVIKWEDQAWHVIRRGSIMV
jgi:L-threonylcarbamoyladenylate synthase